ncbi:MAG: amidase [Bacteroidetes bacterium HGW-Bacteroidetes-1]|jgi:amidase|nr:MAG: amidase [Bacteroidetes bacterium HGW-Bacteroidetes-1]
MNAKKNFSSTLFISIFFFIFFIFPSCSTEVKQTKVSDYGSLSLEEITISKLQEGYSKGKFTIREVIQAYLERIETIDKNGPQLNAILEVNPDALKIADALDLELKEGKSRGPLHGIPVVLKDNIDTYDNMSTTAGSRALKGSKPLDDSFVAKQLRAAGAVILGKANLSEWANFRGELSTSGWSGLGGQTKNPYDLSRNPCGSSSGSAVAVAANLTVLAIGTETNGSIVCPAHNNGVVGIKPTVGLVSRSGVIPISFTQDTPGPFARTVKDAAIALGALIGIDSADTKTLESEGNFLTDYTTFLHEDGMKDKRVGLYKKAFGINFKVDSLMLSTVRILEKMGATIVDIEEITSEVTEANSFEVMLFEYKDGLNNYFRSLGSGAPIKSLEDLIAFNQSDSVELNHFNQRYLEMAQEKESLESPKYLKALKQMQKGSREEGIDLIMNSLQLDAIIAPTGEPAWKTDIVNGDSYHLGTSSPAAMAGYPNISVPMGYIEGLPVGISFFGRAWSEPLLIEMTYAFEHATKHRQVPKFLRTE